MTTFFVPIKRSIVSGPYRPSILLLLVLITGNGCGYNLQTMYPTEVQTVYVPIAQSNDYRRNLEFRLTESLIKEIEEKTPYKVVDRVQADTILEARIVSLSKHPLNETPTDEPRALQLNLAAEVRWQDLRNGVVLMEPRQVPVPDSLHKVVGTARFVPEVGQSFATGSQQAIDRIAERIVAMMEEQW